ncbi:hypothetical protein CEXT_517951 [Caerostris extrusa]|uniref:Uncharacterized protein n=1 Tax=Caerostris extrusa TaxID=172846 RepID=A0AAV4SGZ2_CAEEX|nr:hypothetical protein CEXT_517951 [Caerostris extrusa]
MAQKEKKQNPCNMVPFTANQLARDNMTPQCTLLPINIRTQCPSPYNSRRRTATEMVSPNSMLRDGITTRPPPRVSCRSDKSQEKNQEKREWSQICRSVFEKYFESQLIREGFFSNISIAFSKKYDE